MSRQHSSREKKSTNNKKTLLLSKETKEGLMVSSFTLNIALHLAVKCFVSLSITILDIIQYVYK